MVKERDKKLRRIREPSERALTSQQAPQSVQARPNPPSLVLNATQQAWLSPTLPPEEVAKWQTLVPDAPERFLRYMEKEQAHRHDLQRVSLRQVGRAQAYVFTLAMAGMLVSGAAAVAGHIWGLAGALAALVPVIGAIRQRQKEHPQLPAPPSSEQPEK